MARVSTVLALFRNFVLIPLDKNSKETFVDTFIIGNREYFKPLHWRGKFPKIPERRVKARKLGHLTIGGAFICRYDWLKGSHMTKVVWLPNETDYSYCEFVAPNTPYSNLSFADNITTLKAAIAFIGESSRFTEIAVSSINSFLY